MILGAKSEGSFRSPRRRPRSADPAPAPPRAATDAERPHKPTGKSPLLNKSKIQLGSNKLWKSFSQLADSCSRYLCCDCVVELKLKLPNPRYICLVNCPYVLCMSCDVKILPEKKLDENYIHYFLDDSVYL